MNNRKPRPLKIAMIGSKGVPAMFGGIERHVEEISVRLAGRGHDVTVFGRKSFCKPGDYRGVRSVILPSIQTKNLDTATNTFLSTLRAASGDFDILHFHGIGPSLFCPLAGWSSKATVATIHALDYRQVKWGRFATSMLRRGEKTAVRCPDASVAVSRLMTEQLTGKYGKKVHYIPNGATISQAPDFSSAGKFGLEKDGYILTVGRFIREKGFHTLLEAYRSIDTSKKLVIVGEESSAEEYTRLLHRFADDRVVFTGYLAGEALDELYANSFLYVLSSTVEGLPISLIEAMSFGRPVLVSDIPENLEVAEGLAFTFRSGDTNDLAVELQRALACDSGKLERMGKASLERIRDHYNWDLVAESLEGLYYSLKK